jgi:hypothetical protein
MVEKPEERDLIIVGPTADERHINREEDEAIPF